MASRESLPLHLRTTPQLLCLPRVRSDHITLWFANKQSRLATILPITVKMSSKNECTERYSEISCHCSDDEKDKRLRHAARYSKLLDKAVAPQSILQTFKKIFGYPFGTIRHAMWGGMWRGEEDGRLPVTCCRTQRNCI